MDLESNTLSKVRVGHLRRQEALRETYSTGLSQAGRATLKYGVVNVYGLGNIKG